MLDHLPTSPNGAGIGDPTDADLFAPTPCAGNTINGSIFIRDSAGSRIEVEGNTITRSVEIFDSTPSVSSNTKDEIVAIIDERVDERVHAILLEELPQYFALHGITAEKPSHPVLYGEGAHDLGEPDERNQELTAEEVRGMPLAYGFQPGRASTPLTANADFQAFNRQATAGNSAMEAFRELIGEALARRTNPDEPATRAGDKALTPAELAGVPIARGF